jgi:hypothetical protein
MTPEERKAYMKAYREKNKERIAETNSIWSKNNKERQVINNSNWNKTPDGKKSLTIARWKNRGLIHDDYDALYDSYLEATHCTACKSEFKDSRDMDHDHTTGLFRQFLCRQCNIFDRWLNKQ